MSLYRHVALNGARGRWRGHRVSVRACTLGAVSVLYLGLVQPAEAVVKAPGYFAGPEVAGGGLLWAAAEGVFLTTRTDTRLLVRDAGLSAVHVEDGWVVVTDGSGPKVGRIGRRLRTVRRLHRCPPILGYREGERVEAVANGNLYAVVRATCLGRRPRSAQFLVHVRLGTGDLHVIGRVPSGAISLAAAGSRLTLTYETGARPTYEALAGSRVRVEVVDSRNGRLLYRLAPPPGERGSYLDTQLDAKGDVLVTSRRDSPLPGLSEAFGWLGTSGMRVSRPLESESSGRGSLSEGRIAYATSRKGETSIDVLNLATGKTRTIVTFSGSVHPEGLALGNNVLAWAQQRSAYQLAAGGCVGLYAVGPAELTATPLSATGLPIAVKANPGTPPAGRSCPPPP